VIDMGWRMFGIREKFASPIGKVLKVVRLIRNSGKGGLSVSSYSYTNQDLSQPNTFNSQAYITGNQCMHEIETQKAIAISVSRHERWKAGGQV
jgi:hypothetical protein